MKMYMANHLVALENDKCLKACNHWKGRHVFNAIDDGSSIGGDG